jgi:hypothetical protein
MLPDNSDYNFKGNIDDLMLFNYGIDGHTVEQIYSGEISGIEQVTRRNGFMIFPNPARGYATLTANDGDFSADKIWLTNALGSVVWTAGNNNYYMHHDKLVLPLRNLSTGLYFVCILAKGEMQTLKLVIY